MILSMSCEPANNGTRSCFASAAPRILRFGLVAAALALAGSARGQTDGVEVDPAAAALFRKGRTLVAQGDWAAGCEKFRESLARHASASTVLNLAQCAEHEGKTASAWALYQRAQVVNRETRLEGRRRVLDEIASAGIARLEPTLPRLIVIVSNSPEGVDVQESGRSLPLEEAVPLDPGTHEISASAPGFEPFARSVALVAGKTTRLEIELTPLPAEPKAAAPLAPHRKGPTPAATDTTRPEPADEVPTWAWVVGGGGIVATGVAVFFVFDAIDARNQLVQKCGSDLVCTEDPTFDPGPLNSRKNRSIGLAGGLGAAGAVAITASAVAILSARSRPARASGGVWLAPQSAGGSLSLQF